MESQTEEVFSSPVNEEFLDRGRTWSVHHPSWLVDWPHAWMAQGFWDTWSHSVFPSQHGKIRRGAFHFLELSQNLRTCFLQRICSASPLSPPVPQGPHYP